MKIVLDLTTQEWIDLTSVLELVKARLLDKPMDLNQYSSEVDERVGRINVVNKLVMAMQKPKLK